LGIIGVEGLLDTCIKGQPFNRNPWIRSWVFMSGGIIMALFLGHFLVIYI
jgi:hypothetical protein